MVKESQNREWKESWRDEYLKWICGFANADGGTLTIGKNDQGQSVGVKNAKELLEMLPNKVRDLLGIMVDINLRKSSGKEYLEIVVPAYPNPISCRGDYYYRSGSTNQTLKGAALDRFLLRKQGKHWDGVLEPSFKPKNCSAEALKLFKEKAKQSGRMDPAVLKDGREVLLGNLELVEAQGLKRAACLLFSNRPEGFVSGSWIKIGFFASDEDLRYQDEIHGNLFEQVERVLELLYTKYLKAYITYQGIQRIEKFLYPREALREALLNAVVHKDYSSGIPIQISVYENKLCLWNPGHLPEGWTMKRLLGKHPSKPANPLLANAFFRAGYIESWGRGIDKMNAECRKHDIAKPNYDFEMSGLMLTFQANPAHMREEGSQVIALGKIPKTREKTREKILKLIKENPTISTMEMAQVLNLTFKGIEWQIKKLKDQGTLKRIGADKGGYWEVVKKGEEK